MNHAKLVNVGLSLSSGPLKQAQHKVILHNINATFEQGEFTVIVRALPLP
jgi:hypothetical protein